MGARTNHSSASAAVSSPAFESKKMKKQTLGNEELISEQLGEEDALAELDSKPSTPKPTGRGKRQKKSKKSADGTDASESSAAEESCTDGQSEREYEDAFKALSIKSPKAKESASADSKKVDTVSDSCKKDDSCKKGDTCSKKEGACNKKISDTCCNKDGPCNKNAAAAGCKKDGACTKASKEGCCKKKSDASSGCCSKKPSGGCCSPNAAPGTPSKAPATAERSCSIM